MLLVLNPKHLKANTNTLILVTRPKNKVYKLALLIKATLLPKLKLLPPIQKLTQTFPLVGQKKARKLGMTENKVYLIALLV